MSERTPDCKHIIQHYFIVNVFTLRTYADYSSSGSRDFYLISMVANDNDKNMVVAVSNHRVRSYLSMNNLLLLLPLGSLHQ